MVSALCLLHGLMLGQAPLAAPQPAIRVAISQPTALEQASPSALPANAPAVQPDPARPGLTPESTVETPAKAEPPFSIFSRPHYADRGGLSFVFGSGPGRFNMIDWENRPSVDRYWWLGRWQPPDEVQIHAGIGFGIHWWAGPVTDGAAPPPNLPPQVFDLFLDFNWSQRWTEGLTSQVRVRPGLYTDFRTTPPDGFRIPGEAVFVYHARPDFFLVAGAGYLQRNDVQLLPIGGVLWQPTPRWEMNLVFPEPKIAFALSTKQQLWGYVATEYGGGRWTYKNDLGQSERVEYSDYRLLVGLEWRDGPVNKVPLLQKSASFFETGYVFERRLRFAGPEAQFDPRPTWMIRFGTAW